MTMPTKLQWGESQFAHMSKEELVPLVEMMYMAISSADWVLTCLHRLHPESGYWTVGAGARAKERTSQVLDAVELLHDHDDAYRAFFRYADSVMFKRSPSNPPWFICDRCLNMIHRGDDVDPPTVSVHYDGKGGECAGSYRLFTRGPEAH